MRKKILVSMIVASAIGVGVVAGTSLIQASEAKIEESVPVSKEELPANLVYDASHPDEIYVKDSGVFVKVNPTSVSYEDENVVNSELDVTRDTTVIVANDATYVKTREWK